YLNAELVEVAASSSSSSSACHKPIDWNLAKNAKALDQVQRHCRRRLFASSTLIVVVGTCVHAAERCNGTVSIVRIDPACLNRVTNASRYSSGVVEDIL